MIQYFIVELDGEVEGMFQSNTPEWAAVQIAQLRLNQPELTIKTIDEASYMSILNNLKAKMENN